MTIRDVIASSIGVIPAHNVKELLEYYVNNLNDDGIGRLKLQGTERNVTDIAGHVTSLYDISFYIYDNRLYVEGYVFYKLLII